MIAVSRRPKFTIYELAPRRSRFFTARPSISTHKPSRTVLVDYGYELRYITRQQAVVMLRQARNNEPVTQFQGWY